MLLKLRNIGMIKEADVRLDGLTVIAGENDSGKSTIGKVLFSLIKADMISLVKTRTLQAQSFDEERIKNMNSQIGLVFKNIICRRKNTDVFEASAIWIDDVENIYYEVKFRNKGDRDECYLFKGVDENMHRTFKDAVFIQTPFVWDLANTLQDIATINEESEILGLATRVQYPYLFWDLYLKTRPRQQKEEDLKFVEILNYISDEILYGEIYIKERKGFYFRRKDGVEFPVENLSSGGKSFLILQSLLANNLIEPTRFMIIDEPEVHLHPKWQLEYAKVIIQLVAQGIKVLVVTHSPYMIEALKRYSETSQVQNKTMFYLAEEKEKESFIFEQLSLEAIFEKLALPLRELKKLKIEAYANGTI